MMLHFVANATKAEYRQHGNKQYLVAPVVMLVEGVLNGELVPADELTKFAEAWNGRPFMIDHPRDADGRPISANSPDVLSMAQIGSIYNVEALPDKLRAEIWVDPQAAKSKKGGAEVIQKLLAGQLEVSTGYWRDLDENSGEFNGSRYEGIARNLRPDHLAALPHAVGACSWRDGCGAPRVNQATFHAPESARNNARKALRWRDEHPEEIRGGTQVGWTRANQLAKDEPLSLETVCRMAAFNRHRENAEIAPEFVDTPWRDAGHVAWLLWGGTTGVNWAMETCQRERGNSMNVNVLSEARMPVYKTITTRAWEAPAVGDYINVMPESLRPESSRVADMSAEARRWIAEKSLLGDPEADNARDLLFFPVVTPQGALSAGALRAVLGGRGAAADIPESALESAREVANLLLDEHFRDEPSENNMTLLKRIWEGLQKLIGQPHTPMEENMEERKMVMEYFGFSTEDTAALPETVVAILAAHIAEMQNAADAPPAEQEATPPAVNTLCAEARAWLESNGGLDAVRTLVENARKAEAAQRAALIEKIAANSSVTHAQLVNYDTDALQVMADLAKVADYTGQGSGAAATEPHYIVRTNNRAHKKEQ